MSFTEITVPDPTKRQVQVVIATSDFSQS